MELRRCLGAGSGAARRVNGRATSRIHRSAAARELNRACEPAGLPRGARRTERDRDRRFFMARDSDTYCLLPVTHRAIRKRTCAFFTVIERACTASCSVYRRHQFIRSYLACCGACGSIPFRVTPGRIDFGGLFSGRGRNAVGP